jgi:hypothetical protein
MEGIEKIKLFIEQTCIKHNIDASHGLEHSLQTLEWSLKLTKDITHSAKESTIIQLACLLHDMCDKKYMDEYEGIKNIIIFLNYELKIAEDVLEAVVFIINTMSYSKVIKYGYPDFKMDKRLEFCYHIVRNSDLLGSYEPERCIGYQIRCGGSRRDGIIKMLELFDNRILTLITDGYINLEASIEYANELHQKALVELDKYKKELK